MIVADLSHWNFPADATEADVELALTRAKVAGLGAVLWKCTESTNIVDRTYAWGQVICQKLGILFAGYHFFRHGDPDAQLAWFLQNANNPTRKALDFEDGEIPGAEVFVQRLQKRDNRYPLLYTRQSYIYEKIGRAATLLSNCDLWLASYTNAAVLPSQWLSYALWQYTDVGHLDGFSSNIDLNRFNYALGDIATWWRGNVTDLLTQVRVIAPTKVIAIKEPTLNGDIAGRYAVGETIQIFPQTIEDKDNAGVFFYATPENWYVLVEDVQTADNTNPQPPPTPDPIPAPSQNTPMWVFNTQSVLNVRISPSTSAGVVRLLDKTAVQLPDGTPVTMTGPASKTDPFFAPITVTFKGVVVAGYAAAKYLTATAPKS